MSFSDRQVSPNPTVGSATARGRTTTLGADRVIDQPGLPGILSKLLVGGRPQGAASGW